MILFDGVQTKEPRVKESTKRDVLCTILFDILEHSAAMPFRWYGNKYMCFFCCSQFVESSKLKEHTKEEHHGSRKRNVLRFLIGCGSVKLDITDLSCKKCPKRIGNLEEFLKHLSEAHDVSYEEQITNNIFSFKLSDDGMSCLDCGMGFRFFGPLLMHVHKFHNKRKSFLCEICGQGFVARANVVSHIRTVHCNDQRNCVKCDKVFTSHSSFSSHYNKVHLKERLKCPKCPEILGSNYLKKRHLALVHDVKSAQYKCKFCSKIFIHHSKLVTHIQRVHVKEKSIACDVCGFKVFNKELLKRHMVKHDGSRPFECEFCKKTFQRKKTLEFHRRIHTNDKRYSCMECGKAFVQFTSWKFHLRVHHSINK